MKIEKVRVNFLIPVHLREFVKEQANVLGVPYSTMYIMIVNLYKDNSTAMKALEQIKQLQDVEK